MADVIFSGSSARPPASRASIELIFDNSDGRFGGQYAGFAEISVRRQVIKDGVSQYFFNGRPCRRKDIADLFAGTGLGPGGYSIIEQGMIERIIEAKPAELRAYLEEAAGISRYKEKRRETENRIRHSENNLERLDDLREEMARTLKHLEQQVRAANRYKKLKAQEERLEAELLYLQWNALEQSKNKITKRLQKEETALAKTQAEQGQLIKQIEQGRVEQDRLHAQLDDKQGEYYELRAAATEQESHLKISEQQREGLHEDRQGYADEQQQIAARLEHEERLLVQLGEELAEADIALQTAKAAEVQTQEKLTTTERQWAGQQGAWHDFQTRNTQVLRTLEQEDARVEHLEILMTQYESRIQSLEDERGTPTESKNRLEHSDRLKVAIADIDARLATSTKQHADMSAERAKLRITLEQHSKQLHRLREGLEKIQGQRAGLEELLADADRSIDAAYAQWLNQSGIKRWRRLTQHIKIKPPWEMAVETVLGEMLHGLLVDSLPPTDAALDNVPDGQIVLIEAAAGHQDEVEEQPKTRLSLKPLASQLQDKSPAKVLLAHVYMVPDIETALAERSLLFAHESIITPNGLWFGKNWMRLQNASDLDKSALKRRARLEQLVATQAEQEAAADNLQRSLAVEQARLAELEEQQAEHQKKLFAWQQEHVKLYGEHRALQAQQQTQAERKLKAAEELSTVQEQRQNKSHALSTARADLTNTQAQVQHNEQRQKQMTARLKQAEEALTAARADRMQAQSSKHHLELGYHKMMTEYNNTEASLANLSARQADLLKQEQDLHRALQDIQEKTPALKKELQEKLQRIAAQEKTFGQIRKKLEQIGHGMRKLGDEKNIIEDGVERLRAEIEAMRMQSKELVGQQSVRMERLQRLSQDIETLQTNLTDEATAAQWQAELEHIQGRLERLGGVNLTAVDEHAAITERKAYLDAQQDDMTAALTMLQNAITQIDRETRARFKKTFDKVNDGLKHFFPRCFGGGTAYLTMTGENLLDTGIAIMARPPGKKIARINLLSGGEKALTALALTFAVFELNPAPICMMDEVDAPLDDTNVLRYTKLLQEMSKRIQFVYITHNKLSMEVAEQLVGVTMHESGVSQLIAVDLEAAAQSIAEPQQARAELVS